MWLFTKDYFCSVVEHIDNSEHVLVRFRSRVHAEAFCTKYKVKLSHIAENKGTDYQFRLRLLKTDFAGVALQEARNIDYPNFKNVVMGKRVSEDKYNNNEIDALMDVWAAMRRYQDREAIPQAYADDLAEYRRAYSNEKG